MLIPFNGEQASDNTWCSDQPNLLKVSQIVSEIIIHVSEINEDYQLVPSL